MSNLFGSRPQKQRRPAGVSRRQRREFSFETLEARQVMSAASPVAVLQNSSGAALAANIDSYSTSTLEGQLAILERELYWQSLLAAANNSAAAAVTNSIPTDPLLGNQWHLINSGQEVGNPDSQPIYGVPGEDINVAPAWNMGYTGAGVKVAVIDSGVQLNHPDLAANMLTELGFDALFGNGAGGPTDLLDPNDYHGTAVAGLIAAVANNGIGGAGVAPGASIIPIRLIDPLDIAAGLEITMINAFRHAIASGADITNNSWGPGVSRGLAAPSAAQLLAIRDTVIFGRDLDGPGGNDPLGIVNVFSSGNNAGPQFDIGFQSIGGYDTAGYNGLVNSRYTIAVTGVDHDGFYNNADGTVSAYPEVSASVLVAAPTGSNAGPVITDDTGLGSGLWTTDITGDFGYNVGPDLNGQETLDPFYPFDRDFLTDTDYTSRFNGTSASAPVVSGVVALMLEANPNLTWRDVQEILVRSARQNAQFDIPTIGAGQGSGLGTQNTWIINQTPVFHDPDFFVPNIPIDPLIRTLSPTLDPNVGAFFLTEGGVSRDHYQPTPQVLTNGAGYTISQGIGFYGEQIGYAHGVVDTEMAIQLAEQWHDKNQALPGESTFTSFVNLPAGVFYNIPAAQQSNMASGFQIVPGGIGGALNGQFIDFWEEYFVTDRVPFSQPNPPVNDRGGALSFSVPASDTMTIETVEVKLQLSVGSTADALDNMRIMLVSPDGTQSELNHYWVEIPPNPAFSMQNISPVTILGEPGSTDNGGAFVWTFSTNRSWGERSDDAIVYDAVTGEPVVDQLGISNPLNPVAGSAFTQGWQVVIENWNFGTRFQMDAMEVAWHGSPIAADSERVQGFVGIDQNGDDEFNYSRVTTAVGDLFGDPNVIRYGEVVNTIDLTQEQFAGNVTVTVRRTDDGSLVDQFVTGHDGNFYFDLVPDDYTISIEDPDDRVAKDDGATGSQFLRHYQSEWHITEDWFRAWDRDEIDATEVKVDGNGNPLSWFDGNGEHAVTGMRGINFLLDPGPEAPDQATFTGVIFADVNGDGAYNGDDINMPNVTVFGDVNRNGQRDPGEVAVLTDAAGAFTLNVPISFSAVVNVAVQRPTGWTSTNDRPGTADSASDGIEAFFVQPGDEVGGLGFAIKPPANNAGGGGPTQPGSLLGVVFEDVNGDRIRQATDLGTANVTVFLDNNNSGVPDAGDVITTTNEHGAYVFTNVAPGQRNIRIVVNSPIVQTTPVSNGPQVVTLTGSSTISNILFGIRNSATVDFGDLPAIYGATLEGENGARHKVGPYWLGARIDAELAGKPSANADGDDLALPHDDEDGIVFDPIVPGSTARIVVTASRNNGVLQGWVDWNNDGDFNDVGERILTNKALNTGANEVFFDVPAGANVNQVFARFRYGEFGINSIFGLAQLGEVEDYRLNVSVPALPQVQGMPSDADQNGVVDGADFLTWQRNLGRTSGATQAQGDANGDDRVDRLDLNMWRDSYGESTASAAAATAAPSADFNGDGHVDGADFLALQRNSGTTTATVSADNFAAWVESYGEQPAVAAAASVSFEAAASSSAFAATSSGAHVAATTDGGSYFVPRSSVATLAAAVDDDAVAATRAELSRRPLADLVRGALEPGKPVRSQVVDADLDATTDEVIADATAAWDMAAEDYLQQDRAFADLFGSRRRQGLRVDSDADLAEAAADCDEAFAVLADHFEWPRG